MRTFKITYQDRALNRRFEIWEADTWEDAVIMAISRKPATEKLITIELIKKEN